MEIEYKKRVWKKEFETIVNKNIKMGQQIYKKITYYITNDK